VLVRGWWRFSIAIRDASLPRPFTEGLQKTYLAFVSFVQNQEVALTIRSWEVAKTKSNKLQARLQEGKTQRNRTLENPNGWSFGLAPNVRKLVDDVLKSGASTEAYSVIPVNKPFYERTLGRHGPRERVDRANELRLAAIFYPAAVAIHVKLMKQCARPYKMRGSSLTKKIIVREECASRGNDTSFLFP